MPDVVQPQTKIVGGALSFGQIDDPLVKSMSAAMLPRGSRSAIYEAFESSGVEVLAWPYGVNPQELAILADEDPTHSACCTLKATATARAGYRFSYGEDEGGRKVPSTLESDFEALHGDMGAAEFIYRCEKDYWNLGNAWFEVVRATSSKITSLNHIPAFTMWRLAPKQAPRKGDYMQEVGSTRVYFRAFGSNPNDYERNADGNAPNEVVHMMNYSSSHAMYGVPSIWPALHALLVNRLIHLNNIEFYEDKGVARFLLIMDGAYQVDDEDVATMTHYVNGLMERRGNKIVLIGVPGDGKATLERIREEFNFVDQNALRNVNRDEICRAHTVPPRLVGIIASGSLGGTSEGEVQFDEFKVLAVRPRQAEWKNLYHRLFFSTVAKRQKWGIEFKELDFADLLRLAQAQDTKIRNGVMSVNEARAEDGRAGIGSAGDRHIIMSGGQPVDLEEFGKKPEVAETQPAPVVDPDQPIEE